MTDPSTADLRTTTSARAEPTATDPLRQIQVALGDRPGTWVASPDVAVGWDRNRNRTVAEHQKFLSAGEAVLAVVVGDSQTASMVLTDRRVCWTGLDGQPHRLEYPDLRPDGVRAIGSQVVAPPTIRLRRRPDSSYRLHTESAPAAARLAELLRSLSTQPVPLAVGLSVAWIPRRLPRAERAAAPRRGRRSVEPPPPAASTAQLRAMLAARDPNSAETLLGRDKSDVAELLWELYAEPSAGAADFARATLTGVLGRARLGWNFWRAAKRIYKEAEARRDAEMVGLIGHRIDVGSDYSGALTRAYMRRRVWRFLRHTAHQSPANYARFAAALLSRYTDAELSKPHPRSSHAVIGQVLHRHTPGAEHRARGTVSFAPPAGLLPLVPGPARPSGCGVAFPQLWRNEPGPLLELVATARSEHIREWAVARLREEHGDQLAERAAELAPALLASPHLSAARFGWELLRTQVRPDAVDDELLLAVLAGPHAELTAEVAAWLRECRPPGFVAMVRWLGLALSDRPATVAVALEWLTAHHADELGWPELARLLAAPQPTARAAAVGVLTARPELIRAEPSALLTALDSRWPDVRAGLLPRLAECGAEPGELVRLLELPHREVQTAAMAVIEARLASRLTEWRPELLILAAEHPDDAVMLWAARLALRRLGDDADRLRELVPTLRRVALRVNAGGAVKRELTSVLRRLLSARPDLKSAALPLLAVLGRSVLRGEFEAALSAAVRATVARPELEPALLAALPGLAIDDGVVRAAPADAAAK